MSDYLESLIALAMKPAPNPRIIDLGKDYVRSPSGLWVRQDPNADIWSLHDYTIQLGLDWFAAKAVERKPVVPIEATPRTGPIIGYRHWDIDSGEGTLMPLSGRSKTWEGPAAQSDINPPWLDDEDGIGSASGLYAWRDVSALTYPNFAAGDDGDDGVETMAAGRIRCYGTVVEHQDGYRASHAAIDVLCINTYAQYVPGLVKALENRYQCPVVPVATEEAMHQTLTEEP